MTDPFFFLSLFWEDFLNKFCQNLVKSAIFLTKILKFWLKSFENELEYFPQIFYKKCPDFNQIFVFLGSFLPPPNVFFLKS